MTPTVTKNITLNPQLKSSPSNTVALAIALVAVSVLFGWFLILPKNAELKTQQSQASALSAQEQSLSQQANQLKAMAADLQNHEKDNETLDEDLPLNAKTFDLNLLIQNLAASVNVTVQDISITSKSDFVIAGDTDLLKSPFGVSRTLQKTPGSISVSGTFSQLEAFLKKIESSARILDVTDLEITSGQNNQLSLKIGINAYYLAP